MFEGGFIRGNGELTMDVLGICQGSCEGGGDEEEEGGGEESCGAHSCGLEMEMMVELER